MEQLTQKQLDAVLNVVSQRIALLRDCVQHYADKPERMSIPRWEHELSLLEPAAGKMLSWPSELPRLTINLPDVLGIAANHTLRYTETGWWYPRYEELRLRLG